MNGAPVTGALEPAEKARFIRLERTVDHAIDVAGKIAGEALATIRDEKLYRRTHTTFESYVWDRWGFSRARAYRMIEVATAPEPPALVEGLSRAETNPQPTTSAPGRPDSPFDMTEPEPEDPPLGTDAGRLWATFDREDQPGQLTLTVEDALDGYPEPGTRVLVAWER